MRRRTTKRTPRSKSPCRITSRTSRSSRPWRKFETRRAFCRETYSSPRTRKPRCSRRRSNASPNSRRGAKGAYSNEPAGTCSETLKCLARLREKLLQRCEFVGVLADGVEIEHPPAEIDLDPPPPPPRQPEGDDDEDAGEAAPALEEPEAGDADAEDADAEDAAIAFDQKTLALRMEAVAAKFRADVAAAADAYFADKDVERITRPERIPATTAGFVEHHEPFIVELEEVTAAHVETHARELRVQVISLGDDVAAAIELAMEDLLKDGKRRVRRAMKSKAAEFSTIAKNLVELRKDHDHRLRPSLAAASRSAELEELCVEEKDRGKRAIANMSGEWAAVARAVSAEAVAFGERANRATRFAATLLSGLVTPLDLPAEGAGADAAVGLRRKNLKELRRMRLEGDDASFPEIEGASETRAASGPPRA